MAPLAVLEALLASRLPALASVTSVRYPFGWLLDHAAAELEAHARKTQKKEGLCKERSSSTPLAPVPPALPAPAPLPYSPSAELARVLAENRGRPIPRPTPLGDTHRE